MTTPLANEIQALLTAAFAPSHLAVINDSAKHSGHMGDDGSGESHFTVEIEAAAFAPMNRLARQRAVIAALGGALFLSEPVGARLIIASVLVLGGIGISLMPKR